VPDRPGGRGQRGSRGSGPGEADGCGGPRARRAGLLVGGGGRADGRGVPGGSPLSGSPGGSGRSPGCSCECVQRVAGSVAVVGTTQLVKGPVGIRLARFTVASAVATGISQLVLLTVYWVGWSDATVASTLAFLVGSVPHFLMVRYWAWRDTDPGRLRH